MSEILAFWSGRFGDPPFSSTPAPFENDYSRARPVSPLRAPLLLTRPPVRPDASLRDGGIDRTRPPRGRRRRARPPRPPIRKRPRRPIRDGELARHRDDESAGDGYRDARGDDAHERRGMGRVLAAGVRIRRGRGVVRRPWPWGRRSAFWTSGCWRRCPTRPAHVRAPPRPPRPGRRRETHRHRADSPRTTPRTRPRTRLERDLERDRLAAGAHRRDPARRERAVAHNAPAAARRRVGGSPASRRPKATNVGRRVFVGKRVGSGRDRRGRRVPSRVLGEVHLRGPAHRDRQGAAAVKGAVRVALTPAPATSGAGSPATRSRRRRRWPAAAPRRAHRGHSPALMDPDALVREALGARRAERGRGLRGAGHSVAASTLRGGADRRRVRRHRRRRRGRGARRPRARPGAPRAPRRRERALHCAGRQGHHLRHRGLQIKGKAVCPG